MKELTDRSYASATVADEASEYRKSSHYSTSETTYSTAPWAETEAYSADDAAYRSRPYSAQSDPSRGSD